MADYSGITRVDSNGMFFNRLTAVMREKPDSSERLYLTTKENFILWTQTTEPESTRGYYKLVTDMEGVTWLCENGFDTDVTADMVNRVKDGEQ